MDHSALSRAKPVNLMRSVGAVALMLAVGVTAGCIHDPRQSFLDASAGKNLDDKSNAALAALALGDLPRAEGAAEEALRLSPDDPYGLLVLASVYERTARPAMARETYMQLYNLPIDRPIASSLWYNGQPTTVQAIASARILALPRPAPSYLAQPTHTELADRGPAGPAGETARLAILVRLHAGSLITDTEYSDRLSSIQHGGARHLGPSPAFDEIASRLQELRHSLDGKQLSVEQFTIERLAILNGVVEIYHDAPPQAPASISAAPPAKPSATTLSAPAPVMVAPTVQKQANGGSPAPAGPTDPLNPAATLKTGRPGANVIADPTGTPGN